MWLKSPLDCEFRGSESERTTSQGTPKGNLEPYLEGQGGRCKDMDNGDNWGYSMLSTANAYTSYRSP